VKVEVIREELGGKQETKYFLRAVMCFVHTVKLLSCFERPKKDAALSPFVNSAPQCKGHGGKGRKHSEPQQGKCWLSDEA